MVTNALAMACLKIKAGIALRDHEIIICWGNIMYYAKTT